MAYLNEQSLEQISSLFQAKITPALVADPVLGPIVTSNKPLGLFLRGRCCIAIVDAVVLLRADREYWRVVQDDPSEGIVAVARAIIDAEAESVVAHVSANSDDRANLGFDGLSALRQMFVAVAIESMKEAQQ